MATATTAAAAARVLLVGYGRMGVIRAENALRAPGVQLAGVVTERHAERVLATVGMRHGVPAFASVGTAARAQEKGLDAVWVANRTPDHEETVMQALQVPGVRVVAVEKPVAMDEDAIARCYDAAAERGVKLYCAFQRRVDPSYKKACRSVWAGGVGTLRSVYAIQRDYPGPSLEFLADAGGCIFNDMASHEIDLVRYLVSRNALEGDDEVESVFATGTAYQPILQERGIHEQSNIMMKFRRSGVVAFLEHSRTCAFGYDNRLEAFGNDGSIAVANEPTTSAVLMSAHGETADRPKHSFPERFADAFQAEMDNMPALVFGGAQPDVTKRDAIMVTRIANAARTSAETGQAVQLANDDDTGVVDEDHAR